VLNLELTAVVQQPFNPELPPAGACIYGGLAQWSGMMVKALLAEF